VLSAGCPCCARSINRKGPPDGALLVNVITSPAVNVAGPTKTSKVPVADEYDPSGCAFTALHPAEAAKACRKPIPPVVSPSARTLATITAATTKWPNRCHPRRVIVNVLS
jgi:hypothetical protein